MLRSLKDLHGHTIEAENGEDIGKVRDIYFDDHHWTVRYVVLDTGGWLGSRQLLVSPVSIVGADWAKHRLRVGLSRQQIESSPSIDSDMPVSRQMERELSEYYRWPAYWGAHVLYPQQPYDVMPMTAAGEIRPTERDLEETRAVTEHGDPSLRSLSEVAGYHIETADGSIGHVDDLLANDAGWIVRYLVVDTRDWLPGKKVLVARDWVQEIDWSDATVVVDLRKAEIERAPKFDPGSRVDRDYEKRLYDFYGRPYYWSSP